MEQSRIAHLDGLRGLSILLVLIGHFFAFPALASLGVSVFFAISGYLVTRILLSEGEHLRIGEFYVRRLKRLGPALGALIGVLLVVDGASLPGLLDAASAIGSWANYRSSDLSIVGSAFTLPINALWSLAVELHFYAVAPLLILLVRGDARKTAALALTVCAVVLAYRTSMVVLNPDLIPTNYFYARTEFRIDALFWGALAGSAAHLGHSRLPIWPLFVLAAVVLIPIDAVQAALRPTALAAGLALGVFALSHDERLAKLARPLSALTPVGLISYSLYLWHLPAARLVEDFGFAAWTSVTLSLPVAIVSFWLFERRHLAIRLKPNPSNPLPNLLISGP